MSISSIESAAFSLDPLHEGAYQLTIAFANSGGVASKKMFTFLQTGTPQEGEFWDLHSQNGHYKPDILSSLFCKPDLGNVQATLQKVKGIFPKGSPGLVLDLKQGSGHAYLPQEGLDLIAQAEEDVSAFFKQPAFDTAGKTAKKIYQSFKQDYPLDWILKEGSLKRDLLASGVFSDPEIAFFQSKEGSTSFCQCAEVFMNGFKLGQSAEGFSAEPYFSMLNGASFAPKTTSVVYYPPLYKKVYALESPFATMLQTVFSLHGEWDLDSEITTWVVGGKRWTTI